MAKTKGLPYQAVQFSYAASSLRTIADEGYRSKEERIKEMKYKAECLHAMVNENLEFWITQVEKRGE